MTLIGNLLVACLIIVGAVFCDKGATAPPEYETACTKHCHELDGYIKNASGERQWISAPDAAHQDTKSTCHCQPNPELPNFAAKMKNMGRFFTPLNKQTVSAIRHALLRNGFKIEGSKATKHGELKTLEQPSSKHGQKWKHMSKLIFGDKAHKLDLTKQPGEKKSHELDLTKQPWKKKYIPLSQLRVITSEENCKTECRQKDGYIKKVKSILPREYEHVYITVGHVEDSGEGRKCVCELNDALLKQLRSKSLEWEKQFINAHAQGALYSRLWLKNHDFEVQGLKGSTAEEQQITDENTLHLSPNESKETSATAQRNLTTSPSKSTNHL